MSVKTALPIKENDRSGRGLSRTLFSYFFLLSLLPLMVMGMIEYNHTKGNIVESRHKELSTINSMLSQLIGEYFDGVINNLHFRGDHAVEFINSMKALLEKYPDTKNALRSDEYYQLVDEGNGEFLGLLHFYEYADIIIGDADGNILYSAKRYRDFGENLFTDSLSNTKFSKTVSTAMETNTRLYIDHEYYPLEGDENVNFFIIPLVDDRGQSVGFIAAQIHARDDIAFILNRSLNVSNHVNAYVVGKDRKVRFFPDGEEFKDELLDLEPVNEWLSHFDSKGRYLEESGDGFETDDYALRGHETHTEQYELIDESELHFMTYSDRYGGNALGVSRNIEIAGIDMLIIVEIDYETAMAPATRFRNYLILIISGTGFIVLLIAGFITRRIVNPLRAITNWVNQVASGEYVDGEEFRENNEIGELSRSFQTMTERLRRVSVDNESHSWHQEGVAQLNMAVRGEQCMNELCRNIITALCRYMNIPMAVMYVLKDNSRLNMMGSFSLSMRRAVNSSFSLGEGLSGQAAIEQKVITLMAPDDYFVVESGLGSSKPNRVVAMPVVYEREVCAVLELALFEELSEQHQEFMDAAMESIAIAINTALAREHVHELLDKTTHQAETLQQQQEDLRIVNEELEHQTKVLMESEEELKAQSDELQRANAELEEKSESLCHQKEEIEHKNEEIETARQAIEHKAEELERVSEYKSEFLANMSHELRTPLNSMLILARMLADNDEGNLDLDQVESAQVIHKVGHDLLDLINDILDLSKVEAGKMELNLEVVSLSSILEQLRNQFAPLAADRKLNFEIIADADTDVDVETDIQRTMQIMKNLLSNAFKFTEKGGVKLCVSKIPPSSDFVSTAMNKHGAICFAVEDSGIGIPEETQSAIFSAFQQADGSTSRKYGGTGLGLSIAKEMAQLLGGEMRLASEVSKGSVFSLLLPAKEPASSGEPVKVSAAVEKMKEISRQKDDRDQLEGNRPILIVEDDAEFSHILHRIASQHGYKCIITATGCEAIELAGRYKPLAIILDLGLPDMDGRDILKAIKNNSDTADIPVHVISGRDDDGSVLSLGATEYLTKPVENEVLERLFTQGRTNNNRRILVIDPNEETVEQVRHAVASHREPSQEGKDIHEQALLEKVLHAKTAAQARELVANNAISHIVIELALPDERGDVLLESLREKLGDLMPAVIVNTSEPIDRERYKNLVSISKTIVVKGELSSVERLQDEVALFLDSVIKPSAKRTKPATRPQVVDEQLKGHKILLVDDDLRNTFALSKALQKYEMDIVLADNGELALEQLEAEPDIELVLMDIMMPVMDGYEATKRIRQMEHFKKLPVIALTAKAMVGDREKSLQAGASDYLTKPVDIEKLVAILRIWLQV